MSKLKKISKKTYLKKIPGRHIDQKIIRIINKKDEFYFWTRDIYRSINKVIREKVKPSNLSFEIKEDILLFIDSNKKNIITQINPLGVVHHLKNFKS